MAVKFDIVLGTVRSLDSGESATVKYDPILGRLREADSGGGGETAAADYGSCGLTPAVYRKFTLQPGGYALFDSFCSYGAQLMYAGFMTAATATSDYFMFLDSPEFPGFSSELEAIRSGEKVGLVIGSHVPMSTDPFTVVIDTIILLPVADKITLAYYVSIREEPGSSGCASIYYNMLYKNADVWQSAFSNDETRGIYSYEYTSDMSLYDNPRSIREYFNSGNFGVPYSWRCDFDKTDESRTIYQMRLYGANDLGSLQTFRDDLKDW